MKKTRIAILLLLTVLLLLSPIGTVAGLAEEEIDTDRQLSEQLDALGRDELMEQVPDEARALMEESDVFEMDLKSLFQLTPGKFFPALWQMVLNALKRPAKTMATMLGIVILCALLESLRTAAWENALSGVFQTVSVLCMLTAIATPILDCIVQTTNTIREASVFMLSFIPMFSAAMVSAGQPITGATYNLFLLGACQLIAQIVAQTLIPMMSIYLALCICGSFVPDLNIVSAAGGIKSAVNWAMGFILTVFVALLSIQSMLSHSADGVSVKATKFLINSLVPMVGNVLSDAYMAAQGCLRLLKTTVGAYGIVVALFTFLPTFVQVGVWYLIAKIVAVTGDITGTGRVSTILKSCSHVLGMLISTLLCFALLIIVSTSIVLVTGFGAV